MADEDQTEADPKKNGVFEVIKMMVVMMVTMMVVVMIVGNLEVSVREVSNEKDKSCFGKSELVASTPC